jgi:hypothetical protein
MGQQGFRLCWREADSSLRSGQALYLAMNSGTCGAHTLVRRFWVWSCCGVEVKVNAKGNINGNRNGSGQECPLHTGNANCSGVFASHGLVFIGH